MLGIAFLIIVLMTPASPGWFIWSLLFSVLSGKKRIYRNFTSFHIFLSLYVGDFIAFINLQSGSVLYLIEYLPENYRLTRSEILSLLTTLMAAVGAVLAIRMYREGIQNNTILGIAVNHLRLALQEILVRVKMFLQVLYRICLDSTLLQKYQAITTIFGIDTSQCGKFLLT